MTIHIPLLVIYLFIGTVGWWIIGFLFNSFVWQRFRDYRMNRIYQRTGIYPAVPQWYLNWIYVFAGPVGLIAWVIDQYDRLKMERYRREHES